MDDSKRPIDYGVMGTEERSTNTKSIKLSTVRKGDSGLGSTPFNQQIVRW